MELDIGGTRAALFDSSLTNDLLPRRYEGTYEVNTLVAGRGATGLAAFKAPPGRKAPTGTAEGLH